MLPTWGTVPWGCRGRWVRGSPGASAEPAREAVKLAAGGVGMRTRLQRREPAALCVRRGFIFMTQRPAVLAVPLGQRGPARLGPSARPVASQRMVALPPSAPRGPLSSCLCC